MLLYIRNYEDIANNKIFLQNKGHARCEEHQVMYGVLSPCIVYLKQILRSVFANWNLYKTFKRIK